MQLTQISFQVLNTAHPRQLPASSPLRLLESVDLLSQNGKHLIHVVDDEPVIASTLAAILAQSGFEAVSFTSPFKSLEAAATASPHVLISDVAMPGMTGIQLAIKMKTLCPECKVLLFSGHATTADLLSDSASQGHLFEVLRKPIHPKDLLEAVKNLIEAPTEVIAESLT